MELNLKKYHDEMVQELQKLVSYKTILDTPVENGMIIAELIDDECSVSSSGEIKYVDIEVDDNQIVTKPGNIVFVPEEVHQINKDASLKIVDNGTFVTAGTEVVKDVYCHIDGIVEFKEFNEVIHEVTIRPGEVHTLSNVSELKVEEGSVVEAGTTIAKGIKAKETSIVTIMEMDFDDLDVKLSGPLSPAVFRPLNDESYLYLLLPLRG